MDVTSNDIGSESMEDDNIIEVSGLVKRYGDKTAIDNVEMKVKRG